MWKMAKLDSGISTANIGLLKQKWLNLTERNMQIMKLKLIYH